MFLEENCFCNKVFNRIVLTSKGFSVFIWITLSHKVSRHFPPPHTHISICELWEPSTYSRYTDRLADIPLQRALRDVSRIDAHYVSQVVTVMASWQEVVQAAATHMENADLTIYLARREDARRATKEYVAAVIKAREECDAAHTDETKAQKQAIKSSNPEDPVVRLLEATCRAARAQAERAVDAFLKKIMETLRKNVPVTAQGPLIANALSTAFQFQMSVWRMVGNECIRPLRWCFLRLRRPLNHSLPPSGQFHPRRKMMMSPLAKGSVDSSQVPPHPLVMGAGAPVTPWHSPPLLCSTEGISSCQATERRHPAVLSVHHHWTTRTPDCGHWTKT